MLLIEQTIGAATANANNRNGLGSNGSDCSKAAQPTRAAVAWSDPADRALQAFRGTQPVLHWSIPWKFI
jgi:hypothetical protein